jgi:hypothetical protein
MGVFTALDMFGLAPVRGRDPSVFLSGGEYLGVFVLVTMFGMWGLISAIGLLAVRMWARHTSILFAVVSIFVGGLYLALGMVAIILGHNREPLWVVACGIGIETFYIGVGVWSLLLLNRTRIVQEFEGRPPLSFIHR